MAASISAHSIAISTTMASRSRSRLSRWLPGLLILGGPVLAVTAGAQTPDAAQTIQALRLEVAAQRRLLNDWAGLTRYGSENTELPPPAPGQDRVVFLGDQITERWGQTSGQTRGQSGAQGAAGFFPGKPFLNRGISGQTTPQM